MVCGDRFLIRRLQVRVLPGVLESRVFSKVCDENERWEMVKDGWVTAVVSTIFTQFAAYCRWHHLSGKDTANAVFGLRSFAALTPSFATCGVLASATGNNHRRQRRRLFYPSSFKPLRARTRIFLWAGWAGRKSRPSMGS